VVALLHGEEVLALVPRRVGNVEAGNGEVAVPDVDADGVDGGGDAEGVGAGLLDLRLGNGVEVVEDHQTAREMPTTTRRARMPVILRAFFMVASFGVVVDC